MSVNVFSTKQESCVAAAKRGATHIRQAQAARGMANIILATGRSQLDMLAQLIQEPGIDWGRVNIFHLDEYIGIDKDHPEGFRRFLHDRFVDKLPCRRENFFPVSEGAIDVLNAAIKQLPIDVAFLGVGENGHIAFNDPPANFDTDVPYLAVTLDDVCRQQQVDASRQNGTNGFDHIDDVPKTAVTMSVKQILKSRVIVNIVTGPKKAPVVRDAMEGPITNMFPASILRTHKDYHMFLDTHSASLLTNK